MTGAGVVDFASCGDPTDSPRSSPAELRQSTRSGRNCLYALVCPGCWHGGLGRWRLGGTAFGLELLLVERSRRAALFHRIWAGFSPGARVIDRGSAARATAPARSAPLIWTSGVLGTGTHSRNAVRRSKSKAVLSHPDGSRACKTRRSRAGRVPKGLEFAPQLVSSKNRSRGRGVGSPRRAAVQPTLRRNWTAETAIQRVDDAHLRAACVLIRRRTTTDFGGSSNFQRTSAEIVRRTA